MTKCSRSQPPIQTTLLRSVVTSLLWNFFHLIMITLAGFSLRYGNCQCYNVCASIKRSRIRRCNPSCPARNSNESPLYKETWRSKHHAAFSLKWRRRLNRLTHTVSGYPHPFIILIWWGTSGYVRGASTPVLGAYHASEIPYFFGASNQTDFIATDAISKCYLLSSYWLSKRCLINKCEQFTSPTSTIQTLQLIQ
jgi:hypothetical protein